MATCKSTAFFATTSEALDTEFMETGNIALDMALTNGRGLPIGKYVILTAEKGSGKTTTCIDLVKRLMTKYNQVGQPFQVIYIDIEGSQQLAKSMGLGPYIDSGNLLYKPGPCTFEELDQIATDINNGGYPDVKILIIDSLTAIISAQETASEKGDYGNATRARNRFYKIFMGAMKMRKLTVIGISQARVKQNATMYEDAKKSALADGDFHYADIILKLSKSTGGNNAETKKREVEITTSDKTEKISASFFVTYKTYEDKNRYVHVPAVQTLVGYAKGCDNWYIMREILSHYKYLVNKGSATYPKYVMISDLSSYIGEEFPEECNKKDMKAYLRRNMGAIKDFLRSRDQYCLVKYLDNDDDDDE